MMSTVAHQTAGSCPSDWPDNLASALAKNGLWLYAFCVPLVAIPVSRSQVVGATDLLWPLGLLLVLACGGIRSFRAHHLWMALFLICALVSLFQIRDGQLATSAALRWLRLAMVALPLFCSVVFADDPHSLKRALRAYFWGGLLSIIAGIVLYWLQIPMHSAQQRLWLGPGLLPIYRAGGLTGSTGGFGHLVATWTVVQVATWIWLADRPPALWVRSAILVVAAYAIVVSSSRAALLHLGTVLILLWLFDVSQARAGRLKSFGTRLMLVLAVAGACGGALLLLGRLAPDHPFVQRSLDRFVPGRAGDLQTLSSGRLLSWQIYLKRWEDHVLWGAGYRSVREDEGSRPVDNSLISIAYETGLVGLLCAGGFLIAVFLRATQLGRAGEGAGWMICLLWIGQAIHGLSADIHSLWITMPSVYLLTGLVLQPCRPGGEPGSLTAPMCQPEST